MGEVKGSTLGRETTEVPHPQWPGLPEYLGVEVLEGIVLVPGS